MRMMQAVWAMEDARERRREEKRRQARKRTLARYNPGFYTGASTTSDNITFTNSSATATPTIWSINWIS